jgi:hypothetical protein
MAVEKNPIPKTSLLKFKATPRIGVNNFSADRIKKGFYL